MSAIDHDCWRGSPVAECGLTYQDLTQYRIASREIREFVTGLVKDGMVEKLGISRLRLTLGLDELFLDVTEQINAHLDLILPSHPQLESIQTFQVGPSFPSSR